MNIKIQGTIVSPDYDDEFFAAWIDRGIITPSSRIVAAIENADEPIDLYINSYGGDVFAGGEMQIALVKAAVAGKLRKCEVGSIAASMAANIVAALRANGCDVEGHVNSQLMFHGCYTETAGGAQHHEDVAESLRNINDCVIANLKRCGVEECRAWFAEGREKWMSADEAKELNLFTSIAEGDADAPAEAKQTAARLAAFASSLTSRTEYKMKLDEVIKAEETEVVAPAPEAAPEAAPAVEEVKTEEAPAAEPIEESKPEEVAAPEADPAVVENPIVEPPAAPTEAEIEARVTALANERFAKLQSSHDKMISEINEKLVKAEAALASALAERDQAVEASTKAKAALDEAVNQAKVAEQNRDSVVTSALAPAPKTRAERKAEVEKNWQALMHERTVARRNS